MRRFLLLFLLCVYSCSSIHLDSVQSLDAESEEREPWPLPDDPSYRDMRFVQEDPAYQAPVSAPSAPTAPSPSTPSPQPASPSPQPEQLQQPQQQTPISVLTPPATQPTQPTDSDNPDSLPSPPIISAPVPPPPASSQPKEREWKIVTPLGDALTMPPEPNMEKEREGEEFLDEQEKDPVLQNNNPEVRAVNQELSNVRLDILSTVRRLKSEEKWVVAVDKILKEYDGKVNAVHSHVNELRKQLGDLYHKKQQLKNLRIQHDLEAKLKQASEAQAELSTSIKKVKEKDETLVRNRMNLQATIKGIQDSLGKLAGEREKEKEKEEEKLLQS